VLIAEAMGLSAKEISTIQCAALLHDIGKIEMPKHILNKKEELTEEEIKYLRQHPIYSENILEPLADMDKLASSITYLIFELGFLFIYIPSIPFVIYHPVRSEPYLLSAPNHTLLLFNFGLLIRLSSARYSP